MMDKTYQQEFELNVNSQVKIKKGEVLSIGYSPEDGIMMGGLFFKMPIKELDK